jgi:hypothetical protein
MKTFDILTSYAIQMESELIGCDSDLKGIDILISTKNFLQSLLNENWDQYNECGVLNHYFCKIRDWLGRRQETKEDSLRLGDLLFDSIWDAVEFENEVFDQSDLRTFLPQKDISNSKILQEFIRLYNSYREGLFSYHDMPIFVATNSVMEQSFGQEKGRLRKREGKSNVGMQVRIRGGFELKQIYAKRDEVRDIVDSIGTHYSKDELIEGLKELAFRRQEESEKWGYPNLGEELKEIVHFFKIQGKKEENSE